MPLAKLCLKTSVMVRWKREYRRRTVQFSGMQECVKAQCSATTVQWPLFSFLVFLYLNSNALDGFVPDMDFIDSFACLWFSSRFFPSIYLSPKFAARALLFDTLKAQSYDVEEL